MLMNTVHGHRNREQQREAALEGAYVAVVEVGHGELEI